jgi:polysaccharide biosynthesis protein PslG
MRQMLRRILGVVLPVVALCAAAGPARADQPVSSHAMVHTCCTPPAMKDRIFAEAAASGADFIRVDVELNGIFEGAGSRERPDWAALDEVIALAERHDLRVLGLILGTPTWLSTCPELGAQAPLCAARDPAEFGRLAAEVAAHARGSIDHWEIWNEPDADWAFKGSPEEYAQMLSSAYDGIDARVPEAEVLMGGLERPYERDWLERMLATPGAGAAHKFDVASVHLRVRLRNKLADLPAQLRACRDLLATHGFRGPVWVTEHGYPADPQFQWDPAYRGGDAAQAEFLRDSIPALTGAGADQVFVTLRDNLWGEYLSEGLVAIDQANPEYPAVRRPSFEVARELAGAPPEEDSSGWDLAMLLRLVTGWWP